MTAFATRSRDSSGKLVDKNIEAASKREAMATLEECGLSPIEISEVLDQHSSTNASPKANPRTPNAADHRLGPKTLRRFTIQLGSSFKAGVPIHAALAGMAAQAETPRYAGVLEHLLADLEGGLPLSEAMRNLTKAFPALYVGTIEAGERSGTLDDMLDDLAEYLEAEIEMRADVRSAVMYPAIVMSTLILGVAILVFFVVPRFAEFYAGFDAELPLPTRLMIGCSELVQRHGHWVLAGFIAVVFTAKRLLRSEIVRHACDRMLRRVPYLGRMIMSASTLQIAQMLHLFTGAGLPLLEGLRMIAGAARSPMSKADLLRVAAGIEGGGTLGEGLESSLSVPADARQLIATGEKSGSLHLACAVVAEQYKKELRYLTKNVATFIEPLLTLVLAGVVLFVALAAFLPMWDLVRVVRK